jgi:sulfatase maturation enzyme AslB (radical SAM superfamily)
MAAAPPVAFGQWKVRFGPDGTHLFDRGTGANVLLEEVPCAPESWSKAPRFVSIALTNACDLRCAFCYAAKTPHALKYEQIVTWAHDLDSEGCLGLGFGGGEPTLYPKITQLCREVHGSTRLAVTLTTHGLHFTPELVDQLVGHIAFIRVSMDGLGDTYSRIRGRPFATFEERLRLVKATAPFGINYVVNAATISCLSDAAEFAFDNGASELLLLPELRKDGTINVDGVVLDALSEFVNKNREHCRLSISVQGAEAIGVSGLLDWRDDPTSHFLHIDAAGVLKSSAFSSEGICILGYSSAIDAIDALRASRSQAERRGGF